jgi:hypothetical protein
MRTDIESMHDPRAWARAAIAECLEVWNRVGARYARRLRERDRLREPADDVLTLAARRIAPLPTPRLRPLPVEHLDPLARAFNALPAADRYALRRLRMLAGVRGARAAHLASALDRLVAAHRRDRTLHAGDARHAPEDSGTPEKDRPSPESGDGRSLHALDPSVDGASSDTQLPSGPLM